MSDWTDELYVAVLKLSSYLNHPDLDGAFIKRAGVKLDRALLPLLTRIGLFGPIGVVELADFVGRNHSTVSRQAAKLEALGLVERIPEPGDQRVRRLQPTPAGQNMLAQFRDARQRLISEQLADWTEADRRTLAKLMSRMASETTNLTM